MENKTIKKTIETKSGFVEIMNSTKERCDRADPSFYKFLGKLLIEDRKLGEKNESLPFKG